MKVETARNLLNFLFVESQVSEAKEIGKVKSQEEPVPEISPEIKAKELESRQKELEKILSKLGLKTVPDRLCVTGDCFHLCCPDPLTHAADAEILFDLTKITPLIDANFIVLDGEPDEFGKVNILIMSADQNGEGIKLDEVLDELEDGPGISSRTIEDGANKLIESLLKK